MSKSPDYPLEYFAAQWTILNSPQPLAQCMVRLPWPRHIAPFALVRLDELDPGTVDSLADITVARWNRFADIGCGDVGIVKGDVVAISAAQLRVEYEAASSHLPVAQKRRTSNQEGRFSSPLVEWRMIPIRTSSTDPLHGAVQLLERLAIPVMSDTVTASQTGSFLRYFGISSSLIYLERRQSNCDE
jgi:hypothetical protein